MKRIIIFIIFCALGSAGFILLRTPSKGAEKISLVEPTVLETEKSKTTQTPIPIIPRVPKQLQIPKLSVNAEVESVGLDTKGNMDVPKEDEDVAWYSLGFKPGEQGSAVLAGHLDTVTGAPAVFFDLSSLTTDDIIIVIDEDDQEFTYEVQGSQIYEYDKLPMQDVFAKEGTPLLRLITCNGTFDSQAKNYSNRLVVTAKLVSKEL